MVWAFVSLRKKNIVYKVDFGAFKDIRIYLNLMFSMIGLKR